MEDQNLKFERDQCVHERDQIHGVTFAHVVEYPGTRVGSRLCIYTLTFFDPDRKKKDGNSRTSSAPG
jgi:hypothetical protein